MEEKTSIEILNEFAKNSNREVEFTKIAYPTTIIQKVVHHYQNIYIHNNSNKSTYYIGFYDPKGLNGYSLFSGVFFQTSIPKSTVINIRKRNIIDRINPFSKRSIIDRFTSKVVVTTDESNNASTIFRNPRIQNIIINAFDIDERLNISVNALNINFAPDFIDKSHIGIFLPREWLLEASKIEELFKQTEKLRELINNQ